MRTSTGASVTLLFVESGVHVLDAAGWRRRLFPIAGGAAFAAVALVAIGLGIGHAVKPVLGTAMALLGLAFGVAAGITAVTAWVLNLRAQRARRHDGSRPDISLERVAWARSSRHDGRVHVVVGMTDGSSLEFIAGGATGMQLGHRFGQLLAAVEPGRAADHAPDGADQP